MSTKKQVLLALSVVGALIVALGVVKYLQIAHAIAQSAQFAPPPEAVTVLEVQPQPWQRSLSAVGTVIAQQGAMLSTEESGVVHRINFESGQEVEKGAVLVELDTTVEEADLRAAQAVLDQARQAFKRAQALYPKQAISQAEYESAEAKQREAAATVASLEASIARHRVIAPFSGRAGIREVNVGDYITAGTPIVPLYSLDPLFVNFSVPERSLPVLAVGQRVVVRVDAFPDRVFEAQLTSINPQVNRVTRNVELQATASNPEGLLRPGMFAQVELMLPSEDQFIAIPVTSVSYAPYGDSVYVVSEMKGPNGESYLGVRQQIVKLGPKRGDQVAVLSGLQPGERVATSGTFKLRPGAAVQVVEGPAPSNDPHPTPADS